MIYKIEKLTDNSYRINESVTIVIDESSEKEFLKAEYDEKTLTEKEVNDLIDTFMKMIVNNFNISDSVKVNDGTSK